MAGFSDIVASHISLTGFIELTLELELDIGTIRESGYWEINGTIFYGGGDFKYVTKIFLFSHQNTETESVHIIDLTWVVPN